MRMHTVHGDFAISDKICSDDMRPSVKAHCALKLDSMRKNDGRLVALHIRAISCETPQPRSRSGAPLVHHWT